MSGFVLLIGLSTRLVGFFHSFAVENITGILLLMTTSLMSKNRYLEAFVAYVAANRCLAATVTALCALLTLAVASFSILEVKAYLNGVDAHNILAPSTLFVMKFGSMLGISTGFVMAKEGPMVHTGACITVLLGQGGSHKYQLTCTWLRYFKNAQDQQDMITCGTVAGVPAPCRAPVGGVLFALEKAASWWWGAVLWMPFFTAVVAIVLRVVIQFCATRICVLFGKGGLILNGVSSTNITYSAIDIIVVLLLGAIAGILGSLYNYLEDKVVWTYSIINEKGVITKNVTFMAEVVFIDHIRMLTARVAAEDNLPQHKATPLFDKLVFDKTQPALGGRVHILLSGTASLPRHVEEIFPHLELTTSLYCILFVVAMVLTVLKSIEEFEIGAPLAA